MQAEWSGRISASLPWDDRLRYRILLREAELLLEGAGARLSSRTSDTGRTHSPDRSGCRCERRDTGSAAPFPR